LKHTPALKTHLGLGCSEAVSAGFSSIEPEHFWEALTKAEYADNAGATERLERLGLLEHRRELVLVPSLLSEFGVDPSLLRRKLRLRMGQGPHIPLPGSTLHRSPRCRGVFERSKVIAAEWSRETWG